MEVMKLIPTGKDYLWGGSRLREEYGKRIDNSIDYKVNFAPLTTNIKFSGRSCRRKA